MIRSDLCASLIHKVFYDLSMSLFADQFASGYSRGFHANLNYLEFTPKALSMLVEWCAQSNLQMMPACVFLWICPSSIVA
mmetsp:Transcript_7692/g.20819  ORF Transcript_7692/g.20819 Transcript_7692/m.20819 type:complete len:80 (-) Transcript_7692:425-664(-)